MTRRSWLRAAAVFALYLLIAVIVTWPLASNLSSRFAGFVYGDAYETAHHVWWFTEALRTGQSPFFQPLLAWPNGLQGVTLWADPLHFFPAWLFAFVLPLPAAINLQTLLTLALNGLAMWALMGWLLSARTPRTGAALPPPPPLPQGERETTEARPQPLPAAQAGEEATALLIEREPGGEVRLSSGVALAAFFAGLIFMLFPAVQGHLGAGHTGLLVQWPLPLFVWALLRLDRVGWRGVLLAGALFMVGALGHTLQALYALAPLAGLILLRFAWRREWRAAGKTVLAVALGGAVLAVFGLPVFRATLGTGAYADEGGGVRYSADVLAVVTPSFFHPVFGQWEYTHRVLGINLDEGAAFLGFSGLLLGLLALWKAPRSRFWWGVALIAWLLSLGPLLKVFDQPVAIGVDGYTSGVALPFAAIADWPLIRLARTPGRFSFLLGLAWAVILGWGMYAVLGWLSARVTVRRGPILRACVTIALSAWLIFEYQTFWPVPLADATIPEGVAALRDREDLRAVLDVPWDNLIAAKEGMYLQTAHGLPLIAGHVTRRTPVSPALLTVLQNTLDPARLREVGADIVLVHRQQDDGSLYARALVQLGTPLYEDDRFAVFETPETGDTPPATTAGFVGGVITDQAESYLYVSADGWWAWGALLEANSREVIARLDNTVIGRWTVSGSEQVLTALPLTAGYHVLSLALDPPCPDVVPAGQVCESLTVRNLAFEPLADVATVPPASFRAPGETGVSVTLEAGLPAAAAPGATLRVPLLWSFNTARADTDTRFVHILDENGVLVAQQDNPLGAIQAGDSRSEWVALTLPSDLPPGDYRASVGWYTMPDVVNFCRLEDNACTGNEALLGVIRVE